MHSKSSRRQQAENTKQHIFETALELLNKRSYEEITVRDIVRGAQVSIGSFYNYYTSKLDVYYDTYYQADAYFAEAVAPELEGLPAPEAILLFFDYYARYSDEITGLALTKLLYSSSNRCFERRCDKGMRSTLTRVVRRGLECGQLQTDENAEEITGFLLIAVRGQVYNWCSGGGSYDLQAAMAKFVRRLLRSYLPAAGGEGL